MMAHLERLLGQDGTQTKGWMKVCSVCGVTATVSKGSACIDARDVDPRWAYCSDEPAPTECSGSSSWAPRLGRRVAARARGNWNRSLGVNAAYRERLNSRKNSLELRTRHLKHSATKMPSVYGSLGSRNQRHLWSWQQSVVSFSWGAHSIPFTSTLQRTSPGSRHGLSATIGAHIGDGTNMTGREGGLVTNGPMLAEQPLQNRMVCREFTS